MIQTVNCAASEPDLEQFLEALFRPFRLFQRFFRAHEASMSHVEGTGLGLSIIRDTVAGLGGRAWAEFPTKGSVFAFSLPSRREADIDAAGA